MNGKVSKRIRKASKNRREYRRLKKEYQGLSEKEKLRFWNRIE